MNENPIAAAGSGRISRPSNANFVLAMLLVVYTFSYIDRLILSILAEPVKADLGLSDTQMGLLGGLAFALLYSTMAIPLALVADRRGRSLVISISFVIWSIFTALCGFATKFWHMFLFRLGVGIGEAGGVAPSYALITEYFPPERRSRAMAIYSLGIPLGSAAGAMFGAWVADSVNWRMAFIVMGVAGVIVAIPFRLLVRDTRAVTSAAAIGRAPVIRVFGALARKPSFWLLSFGGGMGAMCSYGLGFWLPSLMSRSFGLTMIERGMFYGALLLIGGCAGVWLGGMLGDRLGHARKGRYALVSTMSFWGGIPLFWAGIMAGDALTAFFLLVIPQALSFMWMPPTITAIQHLAPQEDRATASASWLFFANAIGLGLGTPILGWLSDLMEDRFGLESLRYAMLVVLLFFFIGGFLMLAASRLLERDWVD